MKRYEIPIKKGIAFEWRDIAPKVITVMSKMFGKDAKVMVSLRDDRSTRGYDLDGYPSGDLIVLPSISLTDFGLGQYELTEHVSEAITS